MRLATRLSLWLVLLYLPILVAVTIWARHSVRETTDAVMSETARMVASEVVSAISPDLLDDLVSRSPQRRERAAASIDELVQRSEMIEGVSIVDADGQAYYSDGVDLTTIRIETPTELFADDMRPRFTTGPVSETRLGRFLLQVPLIQGPGARGYLRLTMSSESIRALYHASTRRLVLAAVGGLILIVTLIFSLHLQLARSGRRIATALEGAIAGEVLEAGSHGEEFATALETAGRMGRALATERRRSSSSIRKLGDVGRLFDVGIILLDPQTELEYIEPWARELLALGSEEELPESWPTVDEQLRPALEQACASPSSVAQAMVKVQPAGQATRSLSCQVRQLSEDECTGYLVMVRDLAVVNAMEDGLRDTARLRGLARLYMAMAHDLRAPLNAIGLNLELLRRSDDPAGREARIETVRRELDRLERGLRALSDQSTLPEKGHQRFDLGSLVRETVELLRPQARHQEVEIDGSIEPEGIVVDGNRDQLKQAMLSVALNALEVMPKGGELHFEARAGADRHVVRITDTGTGVTPAEAKKIFKLHFTTKRDGSGIGLYVARSILAAQNGTLELESSDSSGTTFRFELPAAEEI